MKTKIYLVFALALFCCLLQSGKIEATCSNVTSPGSIGYDQSGCSPFDPALIQSISLPSGGSGTLEYVWLYKNASTGNVFQQISGATSSNYDPGPQTQTTYFRRCARRSGCTDYIGESNIITITVTNCCNATISSVTLFNLTNSTTFATLTNGGTYDLATLPANWNIDAAVTGTTIGSVSFDLTGTVTQSKIESTSPYRLPTDLTPLNLGIGSYSLTVKLYSQANAGGSKCDEKTYNFTITQCNAAINSMVIFNLNNSTNFLTLANGGSYNLSTFPTNWNIEALVSAGTESVQFTISGNASGTNIENTIPFRFPGDAIPLNWLPGTYTVNAKAFTADNAGGIKCDEKTITFTLTQVCDTSNCLIDGWEYPSGRIFYIPNYGTDYKASATYGGLHFDQFSNGTAHMYGTVERISDANKRFDVSLWFYHCSNIYQWNAQGNVAHTPNLGDTTQWKFYDFDPGKANTLIGKGSLGGVTLNLTNQMAQFGLQIGNGANALNTNPNGISTWFSYTGSNTGTGDINGTVDCRLCILTANAGTDKNICTGGSTTLTATYTGASTCTTQVVTDCDHTLANSGGWLADPTFATVCGDNAGTKLWTQGGSGTSYITLDLGSALPAGTQICANMKLEHCNNSSTSYSNAMIQASTSASSGFTNLTSSVTFSHTTFQEYCYTLASSARYIRITDNGNCAFRVDYVKYITAGTTSSAVTYLWSTGATTASITVNPGTTTSYNVKVTDCKGCTATDTVKVYVNNPPTCSITGNSSFCSGGSTQLCAATASSYLWSTGATTQCISVSSAGTYTVTITNSSGCTSSCNKTVTVNQPPSCSITGNNSCCLGSSIQLCAASASSYLWSTGATTQCISVNATGTYTVTITDVNGCTSSCNKSVTVNPPPTCSITGNGSFCSGGSTQLCAATASSYLWSTGATTQCITVNSGGTYTVTITNANGCTSTCNKTVTVNQPSSCAITGNNSCCLGSSVQLCAPAGLTSYLWSTGATTQCISVNTTATYTVTVTDANGCSSSCNKSVTVNPPPSCSITGNSSFCSGGSTQLCAPAGLAGYLWSTGATTQCITVSSAGSYTVTVTNSNGCTSSCDKTVTVNTPTTCSITGNGSFCYGGSTQLCASTSASYLWSTGATTQCITVTTGGTYTVTTTDANGCISNCNKTVTVNQPPSCSITGNNSCCLGSSVQLCAPVSLASYLWSTGATTQCISVNATGTYTVTVTDANGCSSSCNKAVTVNPPPTCIITGNSSFCQGASTQLCAPSGLASYLWSTGATTQCISVNSAGTYTVTITNSNGCSSTCDKTVTVNQPPTCSITGNGTCCLGTITQLCGPAGLASYVWSTGATTQCIDITQTGNYTLTVTNANGCVSICDKEVIVNPPPVCEITGTTSFCQGGSSQLCAPAGLSAYLWSTGATTQCITVNSGGTYTVTVTNSFGCTSSCNKLVTVYQPPTCSIGGNSSFCAGGSSQLCAATASSYLWSTGATTQCITVSSAGTYTVTITDANGCTSSCNRVVTVYQPPTCLITGNSSFCQGGSTIICAPFGMASYLWSNGETTMCIVASSAGAYTVTITDVNGCSSSCDKTVSVNPPPVCSISGGNSCCLGNSVQLCATAGMTSYLWSTGATTQCIIVTATGNYTVTVTNANGCVSICDKNVTVHNLPTCSITGGNFCSGGSTQLCAATASAYLWNTGATTQCITVTSGGTYTVTVTNSYGCTSSCDKTIIAYPPPTCSITGGNFCNGTSTQLCASTASSYLWSTGATTQCITITTGGTYTVTITDANGCTSSCIKTITTYSPPQCLLPEITIVCSNNPGPVCAPAGMSSYLWSTGATTQCVSITLSGLYTVTVTNANGCTSSCSTNVATPLPPSCTITGNGSVCSGYSTQWCAPSGLSGYLWSTGATTQCITVNAAGTYTVTVTDANGCTSACNKTLTVNTPPTCNITGGNFCYGGSTQLCAATASSYLWSTGATTQCVTITTGGTYTVTITDANGCTSSCNKTIIAYTPPTCSISGVNFCSGGSSQLCATAGMSGYLWSTGATTQCITVSTGGTYTVTITDGNGCTSSCNKTVIAYPPPTCSITGGNFCYGGSTQLCAATASSYLWSTGATTQCITITTGGTYTVTITDGNGCTSSCNKTIIAYTPPTCSITGGNFCYGGSTQLCSATASSYLWSTGATTQCITITTGGTYTVTITDANGCTSSCDKTIIAYTPPTCSISGGNFCAGGSSQLCATSGMAGYLWSTGATTQCITITAGGTYTVTITDGNGCTSSCNKTIIAYPPPTCSITGGNFCSGGSTQLCAATSSAYLWSTGATTQCITITAGGTYTVTITDGNGCTSSCNKTITAYPPPTCSISGDNFCAGGSTQLCAATASAYLWSTGATTQCITITASGTYTVTITDANGCTSSCNRVIIAYPPPTCSITGGNFCAGGSTQLCAATASAYLWSTGATTQCITITAGGTYTVTITDANGCTSSCNKTITAYPPPTCSITGGNFCAGGSTQLCAATASAYLWSTGATTQCITITAGGTYTVTITDANGCTSSCNKTITAYPPPTCSITGGNFCSGGSTQLCAATASAYLWSTGATTQCITITAGGTYTVTITDANGCTSSCNKTVTAYPPPGCTITGNNSCCLGGTIQLCAPTGLSGYLWSTGATTQCITVSTGGTYTVTVTDANGCTSSCNKTVIVHNPPTCNISGGNFCAGGSSQLCATAGMSGYLWNTGGTTQCITVTSGGTYTVTITNSNGCTNSCNKTVTAYTAPTCSITGGNFCSGGSAQLCSATASSYLWSTGATTQCITITTGGTYTVTITDANGCTSSCNKTVITYPPPTCSITGGNFCSGGSTQLCSATASSYLWSTGATTQCITITAGGTYTVTITDANGCTSSCNKTITAYPPPTCSITGGNFCYGGSTQLCSATASAYLWSTGATTQCITINTGGTYTVTITDANGCTSSCNKTITAYPPPTCTITGGNFCSGSSTQLCAATASSYLWSTGATTQCITVNTGGTYTVTITDANGCTSSCNKSVTAYPPPGCTITGNNSCCLGGTIQLCAPTGLSGYLWSTGATTQCITVSTGGTYTVTVTDANGCTSSCNKTVIVHNPPTCNISGGNFCAGGSSQLCATAGMSGYLWNTGATTQCITVTSGGTYTVTITNANGCTSSCNKTVTAYTAPTCSITGGNFCSGGSTQLCAATSSSYLWSTGATTQCITVNTGGTYTVTITDANGCSSSCNKTVIAYPPPTCSITGNGSICSGGSTQWCAPSGAASYLWSTGATTQCITVSTAGTRTVTVTDQNGCYSSCNKTLTVNPPPSCSITGNGSICSGGSTQWCAPAGAASYLWSTGETTQCITVSTAGTRTVTVTDANGCYTSCNKTLTVNPPPSCSISGNSTCCQGSSVQLCAPTGLAGYIWSTGATTQCITVNSAGTYTVTVTNSNGCTSSCNKTVTITPPPSCSISGSSSFCSGSSTQLCAPSGMAGYLWSTGATTQCITVSSAATYTVTVTNGNGCSSTCNKSITVNQPPSCAISGNSSFCSGGSTQLCAPTGMAGYLWSTGATTQCITVNSGGTYTVTVTNGSGCTSSCNKSVTVNQGPTCTISGSTTCCGGDPVQLCAPINLAGYLWSNGATTRCTQVYTTGTYTVTVTDANGCTSSCNQTVTFYPFPDITMPVFGTVCDTVTVGIVLSGATPVGGTYSGVGVVNGKFYPALAGLGSHWIYYTFADAHCTSTDSATITVVQCNCTLPANPTITGLTAVCTNSQGSYKAVGATGATNYLWTVPTGANIIYGQGTDSIVVSFTAQCQSGNICVVASNSCGNAQMVCIPITIVTKVAVLGAISGTANGVCPGMSIQYCVAPVANVTSYNWTAPANTSITLGQGTNCVTINILAGFTTGNITVQAQNCKGLSTVKSLTLRKLPLQPGVITGPTSNLCSKTGIVFSIASVVGATNYVWTVPTGGSIVLGQGSTAITVDFAANFTTGNVTVKAENACGFSPVRNLAIKAKAATPTAIIGLTPVCANALGVAYSVASQPGVNYNWTVPAGSMVASGQTTPNITVNWGSTSGNVSVVPSNACGNSPAKTLAVTVNSCVRGINDDETAWQPDLIVYPNPVKSDLTVEFNADDESEYVITLTDIIGKVVYSSKVNSLEGNNKISVKADGFAQGLYVLTLKGNNVNKSVRITVE